MRANRKQAVKPPRGGAALSRKDQRARMIKSAKLTLRAKATAIDGIAHEDTLLKCLAWRVDELRGMQELCSVLKEKCGGRLLPEVAAYIDSEHARLLAAYNKAIEPPPPEPLPPMDPAPETFSEPVRELATRISQARTETEFFDLMADVIKVKGEDGVLILDTIRKRFRELHPDWAFSDLGEGGSHD